MEWRFVDQRHYKLAQLISSGRKLNITQLCRESGFCPSHLSGVFNWWFECGLIDKRIEESRKTYIELTDFGKKVFDAFERWAEMANEAMRKREEFVQRT